MRLLSVQLPSLPYIGSPGHVVCDAPNPSLKGWRFLVRGPSVMLVSPAGWRPENKNAPHSRDPKGPTIALSVARPQCIESWGFEAGEVVDLPMKFDCPPMWSDEERKAIDMAEMEAKTAPTVKR